MDGKRVTPQQVIADMSWLAGDWSGEMWGGRFVAHYGAPLNGQILSFSKLLKGTEEAFYEFEVFYVRDLTVHLQPYPGGKRVTGLKLTTSDPKARKAVFENPTKDYPTRIVYHRVSEDNLVITLSDPHGGSAKVERFDLRARKQAD